jgi:hypothetical protein
LPQVFPNWGPNPAGGGTGGQGSGDEPDSYDPGQEQGASPPLWRPTGFTTAIEKLTDINCVKGIGGTSIPHAIWSLASIRFVKGELRFSGTVYADESWEWDADIMSYQEGIITVNNNPALANYESILVGYHPVSNAPVYSNVLRTFENEFQIKRGSLNVALYEAIYFLHELGHHLNTVIKSDAGNMSTSYANTRIVIDNCFKELKQ